MTAKNLNQLVAEQHNADLRRAAERERARPGARPSRRRAPLAIVLAALLALTLAASANAAGRVWIEADYANVDIVLGQPYDPALTLHNDTDTALTLTDFISGEPSVLVFSADEIESCATIPAHAQCALHPSVAVPGVGSFSGTWQLTFKTPAGIEVKSDPLPWKFAVHVFALTPSVSAAPQTVGTAGPTSHVTVSLPALDATLAQATLVGANPDDFLITRDGCVGPRAFMTTCDIAVRFFPQALGRRTAKLAVGATTDLGAETRYVSLDGTAVAPAPGPKGDKGDTGQQGVQGSQGVQGIQGVAGQQGIQGTQGVSGTPGARGATGPQGPPGKPVCRNVTAAKILCGALFVPGTWSTGATASIARVDLKRGHTVYATGKGKALKVLRRVTRGSYKLVLLRRTRSGKVVKTTRTVRVG